MTQVPLILPQSITSIGTFDKFNNSFLDNGLLDYVAIDPSACAGFGDAPLRTVIYPKAGQDGVNVFPPKDDALTPTVVGDLVVTSTGASNDTGYLAAMVALYQELKAALDLLKDAPDDLVHSAGAMKVWKNGPLDPGFPTFWTIRVTFGLIQDVSA